MDIMKNIHIIPTDKPSRLSILNSGKLDFGAEIMSSSNSKPQHIYITSDEEIKEGDWFTDDNNSLRKSYKLSHVQFANPKKIILTTDLELIKDDVQAIDDEFLEWFVKNPSCESVEIQCRYNFYVGQDLTHYKIIIPREEPKHPKVLSENGNELFFDEQGNLIKEESKSETLEEAAENYSWECSKIREPRFIALDGFIEGANWQAEKMYSEEEVLKILHDYRNHFELYRNIQILPDMFFPWFERFKKK